MADGFLEYDLLQKIPCRAVSADSGQNKSGIQQVIVSAFFRSGCVNHLRRRLRPSQWSPSVYEKVSAAANRSLVLVLPSNMAGSKMNDCRG